MRQIIAAILVGLCCSATVAQDVSIEPWMQYPIQPVQSAPRCVCYPRLGHWELRQVIEWGPWLSIGNGREKRY